MLLSYCVVNTNGREHLLACLTAIEKTHPASIPSEVLVLDNASEDGSAQAVRERFGDARLIALERRQGKAANDSRLLQEAEGRYCLLLNEDTELRPGAAEALIAALDSDRHAAVAGAQLLDSSRRPVPCAWRFPGWRTALAGALFLHRLYTVQSGDDGIHEVDWVQSSAMLVRREAAARIDWLDSDFFVYSDETDFCRRLGSRGWRILLVPDAEAVHHDQMASDLAGARRRIVEYHRNRDLYLRKNRGEWVAAMLRPLLAWPYFLRAIAALVIPGRDPRRFGIHARQALRPGRGEGIREAAEAFNSARLRPAARPPGSRG